MGTPAYLAPEVIMTTKGKTYDGKVRMLCTLCVSAAWGDPRPADGRPTSAAPRPF